MAKTVSTKPVLSRSSTQDRLIGATLVCVSRHGLAKTTVDDVAREAGVGRATLYRYFPNKQALLEATLNAEVLRISQEIHSAGEEQTDLDGALVAMMSVAANEVAHHEALQYAFANEPEQVLPHLAFEGGDRFILLAANAFAPTLARFVPVERVVRSSEWCARIILAFLVPSVQLVIADAVLVRDAVRTFILPGIVSESLLTVNKTVITQGVSEVQTIGKSKRGNCSDY
ncbi:MAG: TetR/AcrR family transcriptional regulator [Actinomycetes bacterium]